MVRDPSGLLNRQRIAQARAALDADVTRPSKIRKVSLNRLEAAVARQLERGAGTTEEMRHLAGLTRIDNVFLYPDSGDIVLAGPAEGFFENTAGRMVGMVTGRAILHLEDLVVALRAFPPGKSPTQIIGCSIDPTPEGLQRFQRTLTRIGGRVVPSDSNRIIFALQQSLGKQIVTINGVSPQTRFARVMVEADYRMKLIGIGLERPAVKIPSWVSQARPGAIARNAMQRWYFVPDYESVRVSEDSLAMELIGRSVRLVSEDEMVTAAGTRVVRGNKDRASERFVTAFTDKYPELAAKNPVYADLRNLIDMSVVAAFMQRNDYYGQSSWAMEIFGTEQIFSVEKHTAPTQVETAVNAIWKGRRLLTPIGGGVHIRPLNALASDHLIVDQGGQLKTQRDKVSVNHLADGQWWWD